MIGVIKSRRMRWVGKYHAWEMKNTYKILAVKPEGT
jgi:hypothetical protein